MKFVNFHRKPISMYVAIAFLAMVCFWANQTPAAPTAPAPDKSSTASLESQEGDGTGFIETEEATPHVKKGKKFPWLIVAVVLVAGGAALYFFVLKKKNYTLTVTVGEGVTGTPAAGATTNKKGTAIAYNYALQSGYSNLVVTLDGAPVAASGTVTMNADHTLAASATKTFVLTVTRGDHVTGTPVNGSYTYARGTNVPYSYAPASGYSNLEVKLDNVLVANSGTIAMDNNHTLTAVLYGANIVVNSTPSGARIYLNYVDTSHYTPYTFTFNTAVTKNVLLRHSCGYQEYSDDVSVSLGQTKTINANLVTGIRNDFNIPVASCWNPYYSASWSITNIGFYKYVGAASKWSPNAYNSSFSGDYTVTVKMNRKQGLTNYCNSVFLGTSNSMTNANGYEFRYWCTGLYAVCRTTSFNYITITGTSSYIKSPANSTAINQGLNKWNTVKIVKVGTNYSFYINNTLLYSFADATYTPTYCALASATNSTTTEMLYDYVYLIPGSGADSVPGLPAKIVPASEEARSGVLQTGEIKN